MLIAAIITGLLSLGLFILATVRFTLATVRYSSVDESSIPFIFGVCIGSIWICCFLFSLNLQVSTETLTGYIYSSESQVGYTTAHIRFSENAGTDEQPRFCVATNSAAGRAIAEYVGSGKKVRVTIPPYFYFANNPFACGTTKMTIQEAN